MTNQNPLSQAQLDLLLKMAGKQLHIDPNALKQQLERGDLSSISAHLGNVWETSSIPCSLIHKKCSRFCPRQTSSSYFKTSNKFHLLKGGNLPCPRIKTPQISVI